MSRPDVFEPQTVGTTAIFVDSSMLFALFNGRDECHSNARAFLEWVKDGTLPYRRLYTNDYVLQEVATRLRYRVNHERAVTALETVHESEHFRFEPVGRETYDAGRKIFETHDDIELSLTDAVIVAHTEILGLDHILTYDSDFDAFDPTVLPYHSPTNR